MGLLFLSDSDDPVAWRAALTKRLPDLDMRVWPETGAATDIEAALVWNHPPGSLKPFPNLRAILSLGAGVNHILDDPELPDVPIARIVDPGLATGMAEYATLAVLRYHRNFDVYERQQGVGHWKRLPIPVTAARRVGVLGLGEIGSACARMIAGLGFPVAGWSRTPRSLPGVAAYAGRDTLTPFLAQTDILVCVLPLTAATRGILNRTTLAALPRGAFLINIARGAHVVDQDLIAALDSGHLAGATLDVFAHEPLPREHPFWSHPKVTLTPHIASITNPETAADGVAENLRRLADGRPLLHLADRARGY
ncbi:MAG: glyoxylate/hydroxypyruvate reductase A [Alphaproteobacteria bacterium]|nr:glyoxylate/hydroxypyruvate reductase A [Alphaproteobacteria bacterium]